MIVYVIWEHSKDELENLNDSFTVIHKIVDSENIAKRMCKELNKEQNKKFGNSNYKNIYTYESFPLENS